MWSSCGNNMFIGGMIRESSSADQSIGQYIEDYLDLVENVPNQIVRQVTQLHEQNHRYHQLIQRLDASMDKMLKTNQDEEQKKRSLLMLQKHLIDIQMISDEKLLLVQTIYDQLEFKSRQLDHDYRVTHGTNGGTTSKSGREISARECDFLSFVGVNDLLTLGAPKTKRDSHHHQNETNGHNGTESDHHPVRNGRRASQDIPVSKGNGTSDANGFDDGAFDPDFADSIQPVTPNGKNHSSNRRKQAFRKNVKGGHHPKVESSPVAKGKGAGDTQKGKRQRPSRSEVSSSSKKVKSGGKSTSALAIDSSPPSIYEEPNPIDPNEPTYCLCDQISFGEMICCDNASCPLEWFHFSCVDLTVKPKGKWFCPSCRGDRSNLPKK